MTRRIDAVVERVMAEVISMALRDRSGRSMGNWYQDLVGMLLPLPVAIPSLRTFGRRLAEAGHATPSPLNRRRRRFAYAVHHRRLDLLVVNTSGNELGRPLVTMAVRIDMARRRPAVVASRMEVSYPDAGLPWARGR